MATQVRCPECGKTFPIRPDEKGEPVLCALCDAEFVASAKRIVSDADEEIIDIDESHFAAPPTAGEVVDAVDVVDVVDAVDMIDEVAEIEEVIEEPAPPRQAKRDEAVEEPEPPRKAKREEAVREEAPPPRKGRRDEVEADEQDDRPRRRPSRRDEDEDEEDEPRRRRKAGSPVLLMVLGLGGLVVVGGGVVGAYLLLNRPADNPGPIVEGPRPKDKEKEKEPEKKDDKPAGPRPPRAVTLQGAPAIAMPSIVPGGAPERVVINQRGLVVSYDLGTGQPVTTVVTNDYPVAVTTDGTLVAVGDKRDDPALRSAVRVVGPKGDLKVGWSLAHPRKVGERTVQQPPKALFWLSDKTLIAGYDDCAVVTWSLDDANPTEVLPGKEGELTGLPTFALSNDRKTLFSWRGGGTFSLHDLSEWRERKALEAPAVGAPLKRGQGARFSRDGSRVALLADFGATRKLVTWDAASGKKLSEVALSGGGPVEAGPLWWGPNHVLRRRDKQAGELIDVTTGQGTCRVAWEGELAESHDGLLWRNGGRGGAGKVLGYEAPAEAFLRCAPSPDTTRPPASLLTLQPEGVTGP